MNKKQQFLQAVRILAPHDKFIPAYKDEGEVLTSWGEARLVKYLDGKMQLQGGSRDDRIAAREWMSMFWHEAVVAE